ncbi:MAG: type II secretion system F family protein [Candidatus Berkelbacteria bacterium]|nr:type II secretion system F family protein [Candidatus Berkelbacteria bacterium]
MPYFTYTASDSEGKITSSEMEAIDRISVIDFLKDQSLLVISVKEKPLAFARGKVFGGKITTLDRISLAENLSIMLKAGVNMTEAIEVIGRDSKSPYFKKVLSDIRFGLENGKPFSEGLSHYKKDFNNVFISLVKAGEASGKLEEVLKELSVQLKKEYNLISKIKSSFAYPVVLVVGLIGVMILLMTFVLPKLVTIFESSNLKLPFTTRALFFISRIFSFKPFLTIIVIVLLGIGIVFLLRQRKVRLFLNQIVFKIPVISTLLKQVELARFARTLGNLLRSGIPIIKGLEITAEALTLNDFKEMTNEAQEEIAKGVSLTNAFKKNTKLFPELLVSVMQVGEKTGELDTLLLNLADFYEEQVDNSLRGLTSLIEPILLVIVGLAIGGMALSIILPVYQLIGSI